MTCYLCKGSDCAAILGWCRLLAGVVCLFLSQLGCQRMETVPYTPQRPLTCADVAREYEPVTEQFEFPFVQSPVSDSLPERAVVHGLCGQEKVRLIIDTGAFATVLKASLQGNLETTVLGDCECFSRQQSCYLAQGLKLGDLLLDDEPALFLPDEDLERKGIDGIIGVNLIRRGKLVFEGEERRWILAPFGSSLTSEMGRGERLDYDPDSNTIGIRVSTSLPVAGGRSVAVTRPYLIDTGAAYTLLLGENGRHGRHVKQYGECLSHDTGSLEMLDPNYRVSESNFSTYRLPVRLEIAGLVYPEGSSVLLGRALPADLHQKYDGVVGIGMFWEARRVVLNWSEETVVFEPRL